PWVVTSTPAEVRIDAASGWTFSSSRARSTDLCSPVPRVRTKTAPFHDLEPGREILRVHDVEPVRGPGESDVEVTRTALGEQLGGLHDDDPVELQPLDVAGRQHVERLAQVRVALGQRLRG